MSGHATGGEGLFAVFALPLLAAAIDAAAIVFLTVRPSIGRACYLAAAALTAIIVYALGPVDVFFVMTDRHLEAPFGLLMIFVWASAVFFIGAPLLKRITSPRHEPKAKNATR